MLAENKNLVPSGVGHGVLLGARRVLELLPGLDPRAGSSAASSHATSTRWLFEAAAVLRRPHDLTDLPPDDPGRAGRCMQAHDLSRVPLRAVR